VVIEFFKPDVELRHVHCAMPPDPITLLELEEGDFHDEAALEAALAALPPPRSPDVLLEKFVSVGVGPSHLVIDLGCGHGQYTQQITSATGCTVVALDLSAQRVVETRAAIGDVKTPRVHVARSVAEALPLRPGSADFIWCRDMLNHVDLPRTMRECAAALAPGGHMLTYQSFEAELMEPREAQRLYAAFAIVPANMDPAYFESCARDAGFTIVERDVTGSEWREWWEAEGASRVTSSLLRAARLLRGAESVRTALGDRAYEFALADQLWGVYQMIGKLCPTAYILRRD
jgi:SAM-dependent methyltransferase